MSCLGCAALGEKPLVSMSNPSSSSDASPNKKIAIVELLDNTYGEEAKDRKVAVSRFEELLKDAGQVDCPLLRRMGYPVILVSTTPNKKCIPNVQYPPVSNCDHNNRLATVAASRITSGLAMGCVVGNVYALRKDGKDLTTAEWWELWDVLMQLMDDYGNGPGYVTDELLGEYKNNLREIMRSKGLLRPKGTGSGYHCLECGEEETDELKLLRCAQCKTARYCSKECQKANWRAGHKQLCKSRSADSVATREQQLLESAKLKPEQIIQENAPLPRLPTHIPPSLAQLRRAMPADDFAIFVYNKCVSKDDRVCLKCRTKYRLLKNASPNDQAAKEQKLSGICSYACFKQLAAGGPNSGPDWYGQDAEKPEGVVYHFG